MKGEINGDFYCSANAYDKGCKLHNRVTPACTARQCVFFHRKWPTPGQFEEEYGWEYPDDGAVYVKWNGRWEDAAGTSNHVITLRKYKELVYRYGWDSYAPAVCACTPFGKPDREWRPE